MHIPLIPRPGVLAAVAGAAALMTACSPVQVHSDRDDSVPVPAHATWAWRLTPAGATEDRITDQRLRRIIAAELEAKGFHQVNNPDQATLLVDYHHTVRIQRDVVREENPAAAAVMCGTRFCRSG